MIARCSRTSKLLQKLRPVHSIRDALFDHPLDFTVRLFSASQTTLDRPSSSLLALGKLDGEKDHALARKWIDGFGLEDIPKESIEVTYARSSGPGGQHVNKTNSKAIVRCNVGKEATETWLPRFVVSELQKSSNYLASPPSLLISSQTSRSAPQNKEAALSRLHSIIVESANGLIMGETSAEQKAKVQGLMKREEKRRRDTKDRLKSKKAARRDF